MQRLERLFLTPTQAKTLITNAWSVYVDETPSKLKLLDGFAVWALLTAVLQLVFALVVRSTYPRNSLYAAVISCVGMFVLLMCLRLNLSNPKAFRRLPPQQSLVEFLFCAVLLLFGALTFLG
ncbi:MAG: hypothetical protein MHM6MM_000077 [Cercozoa sp. M6MM]